MAEEPPGAKLNRPPRIAIVGHTNTGKTSLIRTLTRNTEFGTVSQEPSTTKHVEGVRLFADEVPLVELYDTPGMEDPIALRDLIKTIEMAASDRPDGPTLIQRFLGTEQALREFEQEAKVVRQLLASDAGLFVIDTRDPVLAKYQLELDILRLCGKPLVAVLNFVSVQTTRAGEWRDVLRRIGLHVHVSFDAVAPEREAEPTLYGGLKLQLDEFTGNFDRLVTCREREFHERHQTALYTVADMLLDLASVAVEFPKKLDKSDSLLLEVLARKVISRERRAVSQLLQIYQFGRNDVADENIPLNEDGYWEEDPFDLSHLEKLGIAVGTGVAGGAASGAAAGAAIDATTGGFSLGMGMVLGAVVGGGVVIYEKYGEDVRRLVTGKRRVLVDDLVLAVVLFRSLNLIKRLEMRGHGAVVPIESGLERGEASGEKVSLPEIMVQARKKPAWSRLNAREVNEPARDKAIQKLIVQLEKLSLESGDTIS